MEDIKVETEGRDFNDLKKNDHSNLINHQRIINWSARLLRLLLEYSFISLSVVFKIYIFKNPH